jgi:putative heme-binding domain-containing protein
MIRVKRWLVISLFMGAVVLNAAPDDDVIPHRQDRPPNKPYSPQEAIQRMTVPEGFTVELVAGEPDIVNPIAMTFDDRGRIWITESLEYPRKSAGFGRDRVKILEDIDHDGRADKTTVFADNLNIPTGVAVGYGGVWVLNAPDLLFLKEKDGREISREVVVTGFGRTDTHELPNSLTWGPDGWLYGLNGVFNQSRVSSKGKTFEFTCAMWRVHPRTREFQVFAEGTSNPYGIAWDNEGSAIIEVCHWANDHLFHFVETGYYQRQAGAYPPYTIRIGSITDHGHQKTAYCGISFFDSDAYPERFRERIYVGNIHGGCINVDRLQRDGSTYAAKAEPDFLNANDVWFMPVALKTGPDGCLYVLDWYDRYHCYQDANRDPEGIDRLKGRLYRVRYRNSPRAPAFDLANETDAQLIARLGSPNIYFRETAQRLLTERGGGGLEKLVLDGSPPRKQRTHALWGIIGAGPLEPSFHEKLLQHSDPAYRAWAVRAAGNAGNVAPSIRDRLNTMLRDPSPDVLLQLAIAARKIDGLEPRRLFLDVLRNCGHDKLIPSIVWPNLHPLLENDPASFVALVEKQDLAPALRFLMPHILNRLLNARTIAPEPIARLLAYTASHDTGAAKECLSITSTRAGDLGDADRKLLAKSLEPSLHGILSGPDRHPLRLSAELLAARLGLADVNPATVRARFASRDHNESIRLEALDALIAFKDPGLLELLPAVWKDDLPQFQAKVLAALGRVEDPRLADHILGAYSSIQPELQPLAVDLVMQREPWARRLLDAVQKNKLPRTVLNANHLRKILESNDREALWAVEKTWGKIREERNPEREQVVARMAETFRAEPGDPSAGERVFRNFCAQCHVIYGQGGTVGPDITANGRTTFEQLLSNVFDPSLVIGPAYQVTTVVTRDGRNLTGLIAEDNDQRIVIRLPGEGQETVPRHNVKYTRVSKLSMMPEGVETLLGKKDLADLFAFLVLDKHPSDPTAKPIPGAPHPRTRVPSSGLSR